MEADMCQDLVKKRHGLEVRYWGPFKVLRYTCSIITGEILWFTWPDNVFLSLNEIEERSLKYPHKAARYEKPVPAKLERVKKMYPEKYTKTTHTKELRAVYTKRPIYTKPVYTKPPVLYTKPGVLTKPKLPTKPTLPTKATIATKPAVQAKPAVQTKSPLSVKTVQKINDLESGKEAVTNEPVEAKQEVELNPLLSKALEDELQYIMTKVRQDLADEAAEEKEKRAPAEKMVLDSFVSEAGDDLKNVLGLNVTKRILDVHNPLLILAEFDRKPETVVLKRFATWLSCVSLKKVKGSDDKYCAQMSNMEDYERVSRKTWLKLNNLRVKLTPLYKFSDCPENLKTIYKPKPKKKPNSKVQSESAENITNDSETSLASTVETEKNSPKKTVVPIVKTTEDAAVKKAEASNTNTTPESQTLKKSDVPQKQTKPQVKEAVANEEANNLNETPTKPTVAATPSKQTEQKPKVVTKPVAKPVAVDEPVAKPLEKPTPKPVNKSVAKIVDKSVAKHVKPIDKPVAKPVDKSVAKPVDKSVAKPVNRSVPKTKVSQTVNVKEKARKRKSNDFEELDDEDILALMSNAIVLDECSGSDDEV